MEKTKKKILALVLGLTASMTLGACGEGISSGSNNSGTDPISNSPVSSGGDSASDSPVSSGTDSGSDSPISSGPDSTDPISSGTDSTTDSTGTPVSPSTESPSISSPTSITPEPAVVIGSVRKKLTFLTFDENKKEKPSNRREEYFDRTQSYKVGTMNRFNVTPLVSFYDSATLNPITVDNWNYKINIEVKEGQAYQAIVNSTSEYIDSVDTVACDIDFADAAQGHTFRITVIPEGLATDQNEADYCAIVEVDVEDGYNVYNALDLSYLYKSDGAYSTAWSQFKQEHNVNLTISPTTFFFQDNIVITKDSIPSAFFYNVGDPDLSTSDSDYDRALGSLRDSANIYLYDFQDDTSPESVKIDGNYFNLDASQLPVVVRKNGAITNEGEVISHSTLIFASCEQDYMTSKYFEMRDINFLGNSPRTEDVTKSGGLILSKMEPEAKWINCIATSFFITFYNETSIAPVLIEQCKAYDNFNSFVYSWGGEDLTISGCEMSGAGGPIIIQDHINKDTADEHIPNTTIKNSNLQNYVSGEEGWFTVVGATAHARQIKALGTMFESNGKRYVMPKEGDSSVELFNLISITKYGGAEGMTTEIIKGRVTIDDNPYFDYGNFDGNSDANLEEFINFVTSTFPLSPVFQSCGVNGFAFTDQTHLIGLSGTTPEFITDKNHPLFTGDYLTIYFSGMMLTVGYEDVATTSAA